MYVLTILGPLYLSMYRTYVGTPLKFELKLIKSSIVFVCRRKNFFGIINARIEQYISIICSKLLKYLKLLKYKVYVKSY
jgi:hypothetical protein